MSDSDAVAVVGTKEEEAQKVVKNYMLWSMGAGLIPYPIVDLVAISGIQLKMLSDISKLYDVEFTESRGKSIVGALLGGVASMNLAVVGASFTKFIPAIGTVLGMVSLPIFAAAATYAVGKVFIMHFASGGTLLTFNPDEVRDYFQEQFKEGKKLAQDMDKKHAK